MRRTTIALLVVAATLAVGAAPMQCPTNDREALTTTVPDAPEECYLLAGQLLEQGDVAGWRTSLQYVIERFPGSRYAARARDDLSRGPTAGDAGVPVAP